MFFCTLLDIMRSRRLRWLKKKAAQTKKEEKNSKESISLLWSATAVSVPEQYIVGTDYTEWPADYWLNSTFNLNPLLVLLFTTGWFWIFKKISNGGLSLLSVVVLSEAALFMCTLFTVLVFPNNDNSYELQNILYLLNLLAVEVVVAITIVIRVVSLRLNLDYSNLVLLTSSLHDVFTQIFSLTAEAVLGLWDYFSHIVSPNRLSGGGENFQLTFAPNGNYLKYNLYRASDLVQSAVTRRLNVSFERVHDWYTCWTAQSKQIKYKYVVFNRTAEVSYADTTILLDLKQPRHKLLTGGARIEAAPRRNSNLTQALIWSKSEALNVWSQEVYGGFFEPKADAVNRRSRLFSYVRSLYRQDSAALEFRNPHETLRVLELLEARIVSQELSSATTTPNYFGLFSDELGQYWQKHDSWVGPGLGRVVLRDKIHYVDREAYRKSERQGMLESQLASNFSGKYVGRGWLADYQISQLSSDDDLNLNNSAGVRKRRYSASWRPRHGQLSDRGTVAIGRSRHLEQMRDVEGLYARTLRWLENGEYTREFWEPSFRKMKEKVKLSREHNAGRLGINVNHAKKIYKLRGSAWNTQHGSRQRYWEKTKRPRKYLLDAVYNDRWSLNFTDSLSQWKVDSQSSHLSDIKRPKARLHAQNGRFLQRKRFSAKLAQQTLEANTSPEVGYSLTKKKLRVANHVSSHRRLESRRYWSKIVNKIVKNPTVWAWSTSARDFITVGPRNRSRRRKKHVTWHIDPDHIEIVPYDPKDAAYTQQRLLKPTWYNFVHWAYELRFNRYHVGPTFRLIRDRNLELPIFDRYFRKVDRVLGLHGSAHHMYRAENRDIRSFWRNKQLDKKERHDIGTFVEEVIWPERYVQRFVRYRKRRRKQSKISSGFSFEDARPFMNRLRGMAVKRTKNYVRPKFMRRATAGVHFSKIKPYTWWNRSGINDEGGLEMRNLLYGLGTFATEPILITAPQNGPTMNWFRWKTWEVVSLFEYIMVKFSPWFVIRGYITNMTNRPEIMFHIVTYLNDVGWGGAFKEYGWEFLLRYMLFSKYTVDFFMFYFYVVFEALLQVPGLEGGFLRYSELVCKFSAATYVWNTYVSYWLEAPKMIYELPQRGCAKLTAIVYADLVKLTNSLSGGFFLLRKYPIYVSLELNLIYLVRQVLINFTPSVVYYPVVDIRFWWISLGGSNFFGLRNLKDLTLWWCSSWFRNEPQQIKQGSVLRKTILNRADTFAKDKFENLVAYPRKNRRKRRRPKKVRRYGYGYRAKYSAMWRKVKQSLVNIALERNDRTHAGYDSYADGRRYKKGHNRRITRRSMPTMSYTTRAPQILIFKENTYSPELVPEVGSLLLSTVAKQRRQAQLVLPNTERSDARYYLLNQNSSTDFVDFLEHTGAEQFETNPVRLEAPHSEKGPGGFYKEYLRAKIKKQSYAIVDSMVREDVAALLQKIKLNPTGIGAVGVLVPNVRDRAQFTQLGKLRTQYLPETNLPGGGRVEFLRLATRRTSPTLVELKQPQNNVTMGIGQNPYLDLFPQQYMREIWDGKTLPRRYSYTSSKNFVWSLGSWGVENRTVVVNTKEGGPVHTQYLLEAYEAVRKCWRLAKKTNKRSAVIGDGLLENTRSVINKDWHYADTVYTQKPPSAEPWGSRGTGPIVSLDRSSLPWDEDFEEDAETYDYSSIPLTSRELREEELVCEPNSYALSGLNDLLVGTDPSTKVKLDSVRYRKLRARYKKEMPIKKTLGRPRPVSFLRMRGRKHRTKELGLTQPKVDTFRFTKNKKNLSYFEKMSSDLGRSVAQKEIFTSTWKQRGGYLLSNLPTISPRSKFKYKADGLRDFGMSTYLTTYAAPYIPYMPHRPGRSSRVGLTNVPALNNRPSLNEELELDEDRDEESVKSSAASLGYSSQDLKTTDQAWMSVPKRSRIAKKMKILTRKKGDVIPPGVDTFAPSGVSFFANLPTSRRRVFQIRTSTATDTPFFYNTRSRFSFRKSPQKLDISLLLEKGGAKGLKRSETEKNFKRSYIDQETPKVFVEAKSGVGLDPDGYLMSKMEGMEGKKNLLGRALGRKLFTTLATTHLRNYGTTGAEPDLIKMRKKQRRTIRSRLRVRYGSLWRPKKLKTKRREPYENQKRLRAEQHIHFPYRKKKFWSQNESGYTTNKIAGLHNDLEKATLEKMGNHFLKTFFLGRKQRPIHRNKIKDYYGVRAGRVSIRPGIDPSAEELTTPRRRRRRKARKSTKKRRFPRRFFSSRNLIKSEAQTASEVYYRARRPKPYAPLNIQTWHLHRRPGQKLQQWAKKFGYRKNTRRAYADSFIAGVKFYKRRTKIHTGLNSRLREFKKNVLYTNSLVVPLGSKKSGNSFRESLDILRASSYARRSEREHGNSESLAEPFIRYFRSASALEESLFFKNKKQEYRKNKKISELSLAGKLNGEAVVNLLFSSKDPYHKSWLRPMSQSRSADDLAPTTLSSSRHIANLRNFAIYDEFDVNWSTFQNVDVVEEDPDWPRFGQSYKTMRQRNTTYVLNDSAFFTQQDQRAENSLIAHKASSQVSFLKLIANYTYGEYGLFTDRVKKRSIGDYRPPVGIDGSHRGGVSTGIGRERVEPTVTHADYVVTAGKVGSSHSRSKNSLNYETDQKSITFVEVQPPSSPFGLDGVSKLWTKRLAEQSFGAVLGVYPKAAERYAALIEQAKKGDFSELTIPQEGLLTKFGSATLNSTLIPIFVRVLEEKSWISWLLGETSPTKLAVMWIRPQDVDRVFAASEGGGGVPQLSASFVENLIGAVESTGVGVVRSSRAGEALPQHQVNTKSVGGSAPRVAPRPSQLRILELLNNCVGACLKEFGLLQGIPQTTFRVGLSFYMELVWLIFPRTRVQSHDKTPVLWGVQQAYWDWSLPEFLHNATGAVTALFLNVAFQTQLDYVKKVEIGLDFPKLIFKLITNFAADVRRMFFASEEGSWNVATGLLKHISSGGVSSGVRLFRWTYFVAVPYGPSFVLLSPLRIKWKL